MTDLAAEGIVHSTASRVAWTDDGASTVRLVRAHQVPMNALRAELGITVLAALGSMIGGKNVASAQARRHARR
jgi:hypothetical protein